VTRIAELLEHLEEAQVAALLNAEGLRTGAGKEFDADAVRWVRYNHGLKSPAERLLQAGRLTTREAAERLGISESPACEWAREGRLNATRFGRKPVWLIDPIEEQSEAIRALALRQGPSATARDPGRGAPLPELPARIDALLQDGLDDDRIAERLRAEGRAPSTRAFDAHSVRRLRERWGLRTARERLRQSGKLTTPEMAVLLGVGIKTVGNWARAGRLRGRCLCNGDRSAWLFDPLEEQPELVRCRAAIHATLPARRGHLSDAAVGKGAV
jgi:excisionase family DNA binding protein